MIPPRIPSPPRRNFFHLGGSEVWVGAALDSSFVVAGWGGRQFCPVAGEHRDVPVVEFRAPGIKRNLQTPLIGCPSPRLPQEAAVTEEPNSLTFWGLFSSVETEGKK